MLTNEDLNSINRNLESHLGLFSDAEMERDQKTYCTFRPSELHSTKEAIDELLALRSLRDAGDEEVERLTNEILYQLRTSDIAKLRDIAIARGQQLREAREKCEHKSQQVDSQVSIVSEMQSQVTTLTEENKRLHDESEVSDSLVLTLQEEVKMLAKERDEARRINNDTLESSVREVVKLRDGVEKDIERLSLELAELRSAPGIDEVDEILRDVNSSMFDNQERLASITRRAIASREEEKQRADEVAGLLKWWVSFKDGFGQLEGMSAGSAVEEWKDNARRILEIVEGK
jgi:predicted RNase H-like nuclease (RuvC/YqgF family)